MFVQLKCPSCGAACEIDEKREIAFCSFCGTKMVNPSFRVQIDVSPTVKNLLIRADTFYKDGDMARAREYYDKVLDIDAGCTEAINGLRRVSGLPVDENLCFAIEKDGYFESTIYIDGAASGIARPGHPCFIKVSAGTHTVYALAFRNEKSSQYTIDISSSRRAFVVTYGMRGVTIKETDATVPFK